MRIENQNINGVGSSNSLSSSGSVGSNGRTNAGLEDDRSADTVNLSSASSLIALAKNVAPSDRQARLAELSAQVRSGRYRSDAQDVTQAILRQAA